MQIHPLFDARTSTLTYVVFDQASRDAVVIDPVLDFDAASGRVYDESVNAVMAFLAEYKLTLRGIIETHAHADHLTGAAELKRRTGAPVVIGARITEVQDVFAPVFDLKIARDGTQFDRLVADGDVFEAGTLSFRVISTPGHTPACTSFAIEDVVFVGDAMFMPDSGVGRCDFPGGSAEAMYSSVHEGLYKLPPSTRVYVGHDYQPGGREVRWQTTIGESQQHNVILKQADSRETFVAVRTARDKTLSAPKLLLPAIQVNIDAGTLPAAHGNGSRYLLVPLTVAVGSA